MPGAGRVVKGAVRPNGTKFSVLRRLNSEVLKYSMVTIVNNLVFYTWKFLRVNYLKTKKTSIKFIFNIILY